MSGEVACSGQGDWRATLLAAAERHWVDFQCALPLTQIPQALEELGLDLRAILKGRRLLGFLQGSESLGVQVIQSEFNPLIWGILPPKVVGTFEGQSFFAEQKSSRAVSPLADDAPWVVDEAGKISPKYIQLKIKPSPPATSAIVPKPAKKYATILHPTIAAVVEERFHFEDFDKAQKRINILRRNFVFAKAPNEFDDGENVIWIRGFGLTLGEEEAGYRGSFANLETKRTRRGVTLWARRVERPISAHPQKARFKSKHPNWGHPFLRKIKKGGDAVTHPTAAEAQAELDRFHEEFPDVTIPGRMQLFVHVYVREGGDIAQGHIQKIVVAAQENVDGKFVIFWRPNYRGIQVAAEAKGGNTKSVAPPISPNSDKIGRIIDNIFGVDDDI